MSISVNYDRFFVSILVLLAGINPLHANTDTNVSEYPELLIAIDADFSASAKEGGEAIARGAQIAIDEINQKGGIHGLMLRLIKKDHRGNPARGIKNIQSLNDVNNLLAVIGGVHTPVALAQLPYIHEQKILYLGAWAAGTGIVENQFSPNYVFRASVRDELAGNVLIEYAKSRGFKCVALVLERTGWGRSNLNSIRKAALQHNIKIVSETWINWRQTKFDNEMSAIAQSSAEAILLVTNAPEGAVVIKHIPPEKKLAIISHWGIAAGKFIDLIGLERLKQLNYDINVLQTFHFANNKQNPQNRKLFEQYQQHYDAQATHYNVPAQVGVAQAYDLVNMLYLASLNVIADKSEDNIVNNPTSIEVIQSLNADALADSLLQLKRYKGAVKDYLPPFKESMQDALLSEDYFMTRYNEMGYLSPYFEQ
jgi:branched-chain amino acid transport system substrate-binding protein